MTPGFTCRDGVEKLMDYLDGALGFAAFSAGAVTEGCNPCLLDCAPVAVQQTTWSKVKGLLNN